MKLIRLMYKNRNFTTSKKKCMIIISHSLSRTGAPKVALDIANYFKNQYKVVVLSINSNTANKWAVNGDIKLHELPFLFLSPSSRFMRLVNKIISTLSLKKFDLKGLWYLYFLIKYRPSFVIHNTMYHSDLQRISNALNLKSVRYLHEDEFYLNSLLKHDILEFNKGVVTLGCSPSVVKAAESIGISVYKDYLPAITNNLIELAKNIQKPLCSGGLRVLTVGSSDLRKGADLANGIANTLSKESIYHWYGDLINPSFERIKYYGTVPKVPFFQYNIYSFTSRSDPWPIAVLEALANGLIIVGWENLPLIIELKRYNLAYSVPQYDLVHFSRAIENCKGKSQDMRAVQDFLTNYTSDVLYGQKLSQFLL